MLATLAITCAMFSATPQVVVADARVKVPLVVLNQGREKVALSPLAIAQELEATMKRNTRVTFELVAPEVVNAALLAEPQPPADLFSRLAHVAAPLASEKHDAALVLTYVAGTDERVRMSLVYLRPRAAVAAAESAKQNSSNWRNEADERLLSENVPAGCADLVDTLVSPIEVVGEEGLIQAFRNVVPERVKGCLESEGIGRTFAGARVELPEDGFELAIDGRSLGKVEGRSVTVEQIAAGDRELSLRHPDFAPWVQKQSFEGGESIELRADPTDLRIEAAAGARSAVRWSSVGVASLGGVALVVAAAMSGSRSGVGCAELTPGVCVDERYERALGVPLLPVGLGAISAGLVGATAVYLDSPNRQPWLPIVLAVLSGAAVTATVWALE